MPGLTHKFRIKKGDMEFEIEGSVAFVEGKLKEFGTLLGAKVPAEAPKKRAYKKRGKKAVAKKESAAQATKPQRRRRRAKRAPKELPTYSAAATSSLKSFLKKERPKTMLQTIVAIGRHHLEFFKTDRFTNKDIMMGGRAIRKNFKYLPITLMVLRKKNLIGKVATATWRLGGKVPF
jgi:hypothetical protein